MEHILTIAGSDSSGGAGIQADLKTIAMLGAYGASVITAVTAQNTTGVQGVYEGLPEGVAAQVDSVCQDIRFSAVKTGMLSSKEIVAVVCDKLAAYQLPNLVVDPVMVASSGDLLLQKDAIEIVQERLLPLAVLVTPNLKEAEVLSGMAINCMEDMKKAGQKMQRELGCANVLVKGGHTALLSFVRETNGETYLYQKAFATLPGLGTLPTSNYAAVKLPDNTVSSEIQAAWDKIMTMSVLPLTEKYTSQVYLSMGSTDTGEASELVPGYLGAARIMDAQTALYVPQLPGVGGRDGQDLRVFSENGITYLTSNNSLYMDAAAAPSLFTGAGWSYSTIQENGYARWYHVGSAAGKTMSVHTTGTGGFWVYDAQGQVVASSVLWDDTSVTLPSGGLVVFAGDPGARFHLSFRT